VLLKLKKITVANCTLLEDRKALIAIQMLSEQQAHSQRLREQAAAAWSKNQWRNAPATSTFTQSSACVGVPSIPVFAVLPRQVADKAGHTPRSTECNTTEQALLISVQPEFAALQICCLPLDSSGLAKWPRCDTPHPSKSGGEVSDSDSDSSDSEDEHLQPQSERRNTVQCVLSKVREEQAARRVRSWPVHDVALDITISSAFGNLGAVMGTNSAV